MTIEIHNLEEILLHLDGLEAVVFDLDDTLYDESDYVRSGFAAAARELPSIPDAEAKFLSAFEARRPAIDAVLADEGVDDPAVKSRCLKAYRSCTPRIKLRPGATELLIELRLRGLKLGIITDGRPEGQHAKLDALGLWDMVDEVVITDELGGIEFRKPCEKAFVLMAEGLGCEPARMANVGDNPAKDFVAPKALGMRGFYFRNPDGLYTAEKEQVI